MSKRKKVSQIKAMILVAVLELEKLEFEDPPEKPKKKDRKFPHVNLVLIKGGKG